MFKQTFSVLVDGDAKEKIPPLFAPKATAVLMEAPHSAHRAISDWISQIETLTMGPGAIDPEGLRTLTHYTTGNLLEILNALTSAFAEDHHDQLTHQSDKVSSVLDEIARITSQVHMISLNATIEAARAGEAEHTFVPASPWAPQSW